MPLIEFTRRGWIEVYENGRFVSRHTMEREAIERVTNLILEKPQGTESEYEIRGHSIMAKGYGVLSPGGGDTQAPTTPGSLTGTATSATTIRLTWTQSTDNIGVAGYQIFRNGTPIGTTTSLQYDDTGRTPSTQYSYTITAYDAAGNNSSAAGPALVTTRSNSAPVWSLGNQSYNNGSAVNISLDGVCTDADGDAITYSLVSGSLPTGLALSGARNQTLSGTVTADGTFAFVLGASDGIAATQTVSLTFTVSTPDTTAPNPPSAPTVASYTSSTITLTLPTSAASDHASYTIQRSTDGTNYGNRATGITASTWQDTGLSASTTYYYRLIDVDTSNNASTPGAAVSRQTSAPTAGTNAARIDALLAGRSPHFAYTMPADPVTTRQVTVATATDFNREAAINGTRIIVNTSFSGAITISASDIDVVMSNAATISGRLLIQNGGWTGTGRVQRVRWTGGNIRTIYLGRVDDCLFDDVYAIADEATKIEGSAQHQFGFGNPGGFNRLAFINTTLELQGSPSAPSNTWAWPMFTVRGTATVNNEVLIIGNCKFVSNHQTSRIVNTNRVVAFDCAWNPTGTSNNCFRMHGESTWVWIKDSWARGQFGLSFNQTNTETNNQASEVLLDNFDVYFNQYLNIASANNGPGEIRNSTLYGGTISYGPWTNGGGNSSASWDGVTVPGHSTIGAIR